MALGVCMVFPSGGESQHQIGGQLRGGDEGENGDEHREELRVLLGERGFVQRGAEEHVTIELKTQQGERFAIRLVIMDRDEA